MIGFNEIRKLSQVTPSKIVLLVMDGVGGLPHPDTGNTELEAAQCPNLDRLASQSICGMQYTVSPGLTPGSAPGHMSLFGYDPLTYPLGRGIVEALGLDIEVGPGDVVALALEPGDAGRACGRADGPGAQMDLARQRDRALRPQRSLTGSLAEGNRDT